MKDFLLKILFRMLSVGVGLGTLTTIIYAKLFNVKDQLILYIYFFAFIWNVFIYGGLVYLLIKWLLWTV